jgi:hypothetical protein
VPEAAPTAAELAQTPGVQAELDRAWTDSQANDANARHEEGGWIYLDTLSGKLLFRRAIRGQQSAIDLSGPPVIQGAFVVGKFHTHPNPIAEGWDPGPSASDQNFDHLHGVPDLIQAEDGIHFSGPDSRRGGLAGDPGYPK